jgi:hypothetical protein
MDEQTLALKKGIVASPEHYGETTCERVQAELDAHYEEEEKEAKAAAVLAAAGKVERMAAKHAADAEDKAARAQQAAEGAATALGQCRELVQRADKIAIDFATQSPAALANEAQEAMAKAQAAAERAHRMASEAADSAKLALATRADARALDQAVDPKD